MHEITVGISDIKLARGEARLVTYALGSCVGICIYDEAMQIGGMLHAMLPDVKEGAAEIGAAEYCTEKYVNTGVPYLYKKLCAMGADANCMKAKIIGGAKMFDFAVTGLKEDIGKTNIIAARKCLNYFGIPVVAEATGGKVGRTVWFNVSDGSVRIKTTRNEIIII